MDLYSWVTVIFHQIPLTIDDESSGWSICLFLANKKINISVAICAIAESAWGKKIERHKAQKVNQYFTRPQIRQKQAEY